MKPSRYKIWLRAFLLFQFSLIFGFYFVRDIVNGYFTWMGVFITVILFIPVGFLLSRIVPMQADHEQKAVTLSIDKVYLMLIWVLVIAKLIAGHIPAATILADIIMSAILGIMGGRLGGIGLRVRTLKNEHGFRNTPQ
ncbi:MAG TPA: hypothetical protein EYP88_05280 [Anaerolineales bacterium]|nr:hypothetical protein [Anaerolineales bacterium]